MVFIEYPKQGIGFVVSFGKVMQYPSKFQNICYGAQCIFEIPYEGIVCILNNFGYEHYPSNNVDQNKSTHGV